MEILLFIAILTIVSTLLGGLFAIKFRDKLHLILGFSAGAVVAVAFFELIPESIELASKRFPLESIVLVMAGGFALLLVLDRVFSLHPHNDCCEHSKHSGSIGASALILHSVFDGIAIGFAYKVSPLIGAAVAVAVLAHDFSDGINTVNLILKGGGGARQARGWLMADALAPAFGILLSTLFVISEPILGMVLAAFTGFFLYIGASDLIPESHHEHPTLWTTVMTVLGIAVMYLIIHFAV